MVSPQAFGRYEVKGLIDSGGMADVYLAFDPRLKREVAIKAPQIEDRNETHRAYLLKQFRQEAKAVAQLTVDGIVRVLDDGDEEGRPYLVMEYMPGGSLAERIDDKQTIYTLEAALPILRRVTRALDSAHKKGYIHQDVKPGNILFDAEGNANLSDFGIARFSVALAIGDPDATNQRITRIVGTPPYMSPEQAVGREVTGQSDIYSLGVVIHEMLTGVTPDVAADRPAPEGVIRHGAAPSLPPGVKAVIDRATAREPEDRYKSASALVAALENIVKPEQPKDHYYPVLAASLFIALGLFTIFMLLGLGRKPGPAAAPSPEPSVQAMATTGAMPPPLPVVAQLAFTSDRDGNNEIYLMDSDGSNIIRLTDDPANDWAPAWSPDGNWIAFTSDRDGDAEIYIMRADGTDVRKLTDITAYDCCADWSPDGTKIAFNSNYPEGDQDIYVINVDGTGRMNLTDFSADDWSPDWSPDGTEIAFDARRDGHPDIYVMNADGSNPRRLTTRYSAQRGPAWSPDGQWIAYHSNQQWDDPDQTGYEHIFIMRRDGTSQTQLTNALADERWPDWHAGGQFITFTSERDGNSEIYIMNRDGTGVRRITNHPAADVGAAWRP